MKIEAANFLAQLHTDQPLPRVIAIVGEETYYRDKVRRSVLAKIFAPAAPAEYELTTFSEKTDVDQLENILNTYPFFGGKSAVLITDQELLAPREREGKVSKAGEARLQKLLDAAQRCAGLLYGADSGRQVRRTPETEQDPAERTLFGDLYAAEGVPAGTLAAGPGSAARGQLLPGTAWNAS
jgi:DNA polymerase III delta subunit